MFTQEVLAVALQQLVEQTPVPMLFMRTVSNTVCYRVRVCISVLMGVVHLCMW